MKKLTALHQIYGSCLNLVRKGGMFDGMDYFYLSIDCVYCRTDCLAFVVKYVSKETTAFDYQSTPLFGMDALLVRKDWPGIQTILV